MFEVVTKSCDESLQLAIDTESCGRSDETITQLWKLLHQKACAVLREAFTATLGDTQAEQEQLLRPHLFIKGNANYLWSLLLNQFKPDPIAKMLKAFKALESLRYVPAKSTPVEYNTHFLSAINEIRIANPNQTFDESTRLALYLKGWPTGLHQKLELVKSDSNPTLELAQRHLQRWYDDNGKKSRTKPDSPSPATQPPSTPSPAPSTLAALRDANIAAKKKYLETKQAFKSASSNQTQGGKPGDENKKKKRHDRRQTSDETGDAGSAAGVTLGAFITKEETDVPDNVFDAVSVGGEAFFGAVSEDGREFFNTRNEFILDSGASRSVVSDYKLLTNPEPMKQPVVMRCAMGKSALLTEHGKVRLSESVTLNNVSYAKGAALNAISVGRIAKTGYCSAFGKKGAAIIEEAAITALLRKLDPSKTVLKVPLIGDVYVYTRHACHWERSDEFGCELHRSLQLL